MIKYVNSKGESIRLDRDGFYADEGELRSFVWDYVYNGFPDGSGGNVDLFSRHQKTKSFAVSAHAMTKNQMNILLNRLHNITEFDVQERQPGRLWLNDQYISCFVVSSEIVAKSYKVYFVTKRLTILPVTPYWCNELTQHFYKGESAVSSPYGKRYNGRLPYKYGTGYASSVLDNSAALWNTPMVLTFYGEAVSPSVTIAGNVYGVNVQLDDGERVVLNQLDKTIIKIATNGQKTNVFAERDREHDVFQYAPPGAVPVVYTGNFSMDVTLIRQRSEPQWDI